MKTARCLSPDTQTVQMINEKQPSAPSRSIGGYAPVEHTADLALRIWGEDFRTLMVNAAHGVTDLMVAGSAEDRPWIERSVSIEAIDAESLLVEWLSEVVFIAESEGLVFQEFFIQRLTSTELCGVLRRGAKKKLKRVVKAVTFHNLELIRTHRGLEVTVVFDV